MAICSPTNSNLASEDGNGGAMPLAEKSVLLNSSRQESSTLSDSSVDAEVIKNEVPTATISSNSLFEGSDGNFSKPHGQYEILPGLWVQLREYAMVEKKMEPHFSSPANVDNSTCMKISVRAREIEFGNNLFTGENICLKAVVLHEKNGNDAETVVVVRDLVLSMEHLIMNPLANREELAQFHQKICKNAQDDISIPNAKVLATKCYTSKDSIVDFPICEGSDRCTLRTAIEYYMKSIINAVDISSGKKADISSNAIVSDMTATTGSIVGCTVGGLFLGPVGFVAGSYLGGKVGRDHSSSVLGGVVGATMFGPIGMLAGVCAAESARKNEERNERHTRTTATIASDKEVSKDLRERAIDHISSKKYEYAGSAGVVTGYATGAAAGAILGPIGIITGAVVGGAAGSMTARKLTEKANSAITSRAPNSNDDRDNNGKSIENKKPYKFGDFTRRVVAQGKETRGADKEESYKFGDFTRGLFR